MSETRLLPCPLCGKEVSVALSGDDVNIWYFVTRGIGENPCKCRLFMESEKISRDSSPDDYGKLKSSLIKAWNRRTCSRRNSRKNKMNCYGCAYFHYEFDPFGQLCDVCKHPQRVIPPVGFADKEHDCEDFIQEAGISKWDSWNEEERKQVLKQLEKMYYGNEKSFDIIRNTYTFEQVKELFISEMKVKDKNEK